MQSGLKLWFLSCGVRASIARNLTRYGRIPYRTRFLFMYTFFLFVPVSLVACNPNKGKWGEMMESQPARGARGLNLRSTPPPPPPFSPRPPSPRAGSSRALRNRIEVIRSAAVRGKSGVMREKLRKRLCSFRNRILFREVVIQMKRRLETRR